MRSIIVLLLILLAGLQYKLWMSDSSIWQWRHLQHKIDQQQQNNKKSLAQNHTIAADINELKSGEQALEERARYELGMIREQEVYYQFVD